MSKVLLEYPFFNLPELGLEDKISEFILDPKLYEKEIAKRNGGLHLPSISPDSVPDEDIMHYERIVPYHRKTSSADLLSNAIKMAKEHPKPFAKSVKDKNELERDILMIYQVAYSHYVIAKHNDFTNGGVKFPYSNCGMSGRDLTGTLWIHGFLNAGYACYKGKFLGHGYVILPFVMQEPNFKGVILMDPTSDQLGKYKGKGYRNLVTIKQGSDWTYHTNYDDRANLFPNSVLHLGTLLKPNSIDSEFNLGDICGVDYFKSGKNFLKLAFSNPLNLKVPLKRVDNTK